MGAFFYYLFWIIITFVMSFSIVLTRNSRTRFRLICAFFVLFVIYEITSYAFDLVVEPLIFNFVIWGIFAITVPITAYIRRNEPKYKKLYENLGKLANAWYIYRYFGNHRRR